MACTFGVGLFVTRIVLDSVGASDFGVLAALGGSGALFLAISQALGLSAKRHLAYEIGRGNDGSLDELFNTALVLFVVLAAVLVGLGLALAPVLLDAFTIPVGREQAAWVALHVTLAGLAISVMISPFYAVVEARQAMGQVAIFEIIRSLLHLAAAIWVSQYHGDRLVAYSILVGCVVFTRASFFAVTTALRFPESRPNPHAFRREALPKLARFAGWASLLQIGARMCMHACVVLLGVFFSPVIVAGYAIAMRVREYHDNFSHVVPRVVQPAMTTMEARGKRRDVHRLALLTCKYTTLGVLFFVAPLLLETTTVLDMWLKEVPAGAVLLVQLELVWLTVDSLSRGFDSAVIAHGAIARYAAASTLPWFLALPFAAVLFSVFGFSAAALPGTLLLVSIIMIPIRIAYGGTLVGVGMREWLHETFVPIVSVFVPAFGVAVLAHGIWDASVWRVLIVTVCYGGVSAALIWTAIFDRDVKLAIAGVLDSSLRRLTGKGLSRLSSGRFGPSPLCHLPFVSSLSSEPSSIETTCKAATELTEQEIESWRNLLNKRNHVESPFFQPDYTLAVAEARDDVETVLLHKNRELVGVVPFHRLVGNVAKPVGLRISDFQAALVQSSDWRPKDLIDAGDLSAFRFDRLVSPNSTFSPGSVAAESPYIETACGTKIYHGKNGVRSSQSVRQIFRKRRKLEREIGELRFEFQTDDSAVFELMKQWKSRQRADSHTTNVLDFPWVMVTLERIRRTQNDDFAGITSALYAGGEPVAVHFGMRTKRVLHWWFPAYDVRFAKYSPGAMLLVELIDACGEQGIRRLDLGEGDERYKQSFQTGSLQLTAGFIGRNPLSDSAWNTWLRTRLALRDSRIAQNLVRESKRRIRSFSKLRYAK